MAETFGEFINNDKKFFHIASGSFSHQESLDSGTMMYLVHDISVLAKENLRHLVSTVIYKPYLEEGEFGFGDRIDIEPITDSITNRSEVQYISWDDRTAAVFGPIPLVCDRQLSTGEKTIRNMIFHYTYNAGTTVDTNKVGRVFCAVTLDKTPPVQLGNAGCLATGYESYNTPGTKEGRMLLTSTQDLGIPVDSGIQGSVNGAPSLSFMGYVWLGWTPREDNTGLMHSDVFETRAETF